MSKFEYEPYYSNNETPKCGFKKMQFYKDTLQWRNPEDVFAFGISMKKKYAESFIKNGILKFGSAMEWNKYAEQFGTGKGDVQEGVFAAYELNEMNKVRDAIIKNPEAYPVRITSDFCDLIYLKDKHVMKLPVLCFYMIKCKNLILSDCNDHYEATIQIPARYFRGLADGRNWEEESKLPKDEQHVFIVIYDANAFLQRVLNRLLSLGIKLNEIMLGAIHYKNIDNPFDPIWEHPKELFIKNKQFSDQNEGRIVLNPDNLEMIQFFTDNAISVGSMEDIVVLHNHYYAGGLWITISLKKE